MYAQQSAHKSQHREQDTMKTLIAVASKTCGVHGNLVNNSNVLCLLYKVTLFQVAFLYSMYKFSNAENVQRIKK